MLIIDTSALIRYFTNDIPSKANEVKKLLESNNKIYIPDVVFPELEYVLLSKTYNTNRSKILKAFQFLITRKNIKVSPEVNKATEIYRSTKLDIADCIIAASSTKHKLFSYDKSLISAVKHNN